MVSVKITFYHYGQNFPISVSTSSFVGITLSAPFLYTATKKAVAAAKESSVLCSFDPNIRLPLWESEEKAKQCAAYGFEHCDILKK